MTGVACAQMNAARWRSVLLLQVGKKAANEPPRVFYGAYRGAAINIGTVAIIRDTCRPSLAALHPCAHVPGTLFLLACMHRARRARVCAEKCCMHQPGVVSGGDWDSPQVCPAIHHHCFGQSFYYHHGDKKKNFDQ